MMLVTDPGHALTALLVALVVDALVGDPQALYRRVPHPVALVGLAVAALERRWNGAKCRPAQLQLRGVATALLIVGGAVLVGAIVSATLMRLPAAWLPEGILLSTLIAQRGLYQSVAGVAVGLGAGLDAGREAVAHIVGRDPTSLDRHGVARAAIESAAENFADGVVAPAFWALLFGLPGALAYKAVNTLDSMIGHRSQRYRHFGRFAARLDDVANLVPARLAGLLLVIAAVPAGGTGAAWRAMWRCAGRHRSPNAGWPEAAMAGSLGLRLAGPRRYGGVLVEDAWMGDGRATATARDIRRALARMVAACTTLTLLVAAGLLAVR